jgi:hypothetical protein
MTDTTTLDAVASERHPIERELLRLFPSPRPLTIFESRAGDALDALRWHALFPNATIYAFEPHPECVVRAHQNVADAQAFGICIVPAELGERVGWTVLPDGGQTVPVETIESFRRTRGIGAIDVLRINGRARAMPVLRGAGCGLEQVRAIAIDVDDDLLGPDWAGREAVDRFLRTRYFSSVIEARVAPGCQCATRLYLRRTTRSLLIGTLSAAEYHDRRGMCRASWMADVPRHPGLDAVFLLGDHVGAPSRTGDELRLPCPDSYAALPQRTAWFCRWALEHSDFDYLFKCDDDTYVAIDRLVAVDLGGRDYVGRDLGGWASGGAGYFLSRRAARLVACNLVAETGNEDQAVAQVLREFGIPLHDEPGLLPWPVSGPEPSAANGTFTAHGVDSAAHQRIHGAVHGRPGFRIVMPTSNHHAGVVAITLELLDRYWPSHPPVDVVHHEVVPAPAKAHRHYMAGPQQSVAWCDALARYLEHVNDEPTVMILLEDYAVCAPVQAERVIQARRAIESDPRVAAFYLTWMQLPTSRPYDRASGVLVCPAWDYTVHLQAGIWRRSSLLAILAELHGASCDSFELAGSEIQNSRVPAELHLMFDLPAPANPSLFLDSVEKDHWPIPYHNLMRRGTPDPRHDEFLRREGFDPLAMPRRP